MAESNASKELKETLYLNRKNGGLRLSEEEIRKAEEYAEGYKRFLDAGKTEREAVSASIAMAEEKGFVPYEYGKKYAPGDRV